MLRARVLSALVALPLIILLIYLGGIPWLVGAAVVGILSWREMSQLLQRDHFGVDRLLGLAFILAVIAAAFLESRGLVQFDLLPPLLAGLLMLSLISALYDKNEHPTINWAMNVASALYVGFLLSHFVTLREHSNGRSWMILVLSLTWASDTLAYFIGRAVGRHKLWPRISPNKTWEGLAAGTIGALLAGPLLGPWLVGLTPWQGLALGALLALTAPFGDFAVSLFKRLAHVKDTSHLIPGHGGMLDRLDSLMFTVTVTTYFALLVVGA